MGGIEDEKNDMIARYFKLAKKIDFDYKAIDAHRERFHCQSYHTRIDNKNGERLSATAFKLEHQVCDFVDTIEHIEKRMKNKRKKKRYFDDYLKSLTPEAREYLFKRYLGDSDVSVNESIEQATLEEIHEIEDAIRYMNGEIPDKLLRVEDGTELDFNELLEVLEI